MVEIARSPVPIASHLEEIAQVLRDSVAQGWGSDTAHSSVNDHYAAGSPKGQCYVSAMYAAHILRTELGIDANVALGSLWDATSRKTIIAFHGWVVIGQPLTPSALVIDLTSDQAAGMPPVLWGSASRLKSMGVAYHYTDVAAPAQIRNSVRERWLTLMVRAHPPELQSIIERSRRADLSQITDGDVRNHLGMHLASATNHDARRILNSCLALTDHYSFSETRTYPRPDHPQPRKRRSLHFLLVAILVSIRTTLENEQRAVDHILNECASDADLFALSEERLAELVKPAGMPQRRAKLIVQALEYCRATFGDSFEALSAGMPSDVVRSEVLAIPGFGPKATDCFISIGLGIPTAVVDVNVFRSYVHLFAHDVGKAQPASFARPSDVAAVKHAIESALPRDAFLLQIVHTLLLLYGRNDFGFTPKRKPTDRCIVATFCKTCEQVPIHEDAQTFLF